MMRMMLAIVVMFSSEAFAETIISEESLNTFFVDSPQIQVIRQRLDAAEQVRGSLTRSFLPKVELSYGQERYSVGPYNGVVQPYGGIMASVNVFNSGKDSLENKLRNLRAGSTTIDAQVLRSQVELEVRQAMAHFAFLEEQEKILKTSQENNQTNMRAAQQRIKAGLATNTDTIDFQQQDIAIKQEISSTLFEKGVIKRMLAALLGLESPTDISVTSTNGHPEHAKVSEMPSGGQMNSLLMKQAHLNVEMADLEVQLAKRWWSPSVDVYGYAQRFLQKDREYQSADQRNDVSLGFRITMPIFDGGEGIRAARAKSSLAKAQMAVNRTTALNLNKSATDAQMRLELAHELIHGAEETVELMGRYRSGVLSEYNRGIKNSPDVLQASLRWRESMIKLADIKRNYQLARAEAQYLLGLQQ